MVKKTTFLLLFGFLGFFCAQAQEDSSFVKKQEEKKIKGKQQKLSKGPRPVTVRFYGNHDFYLTVNDKQYPKTAKGESRKVDLAVDKVCRLVFEEADSTGEMIERYLKPTTEMAGRSDTVVFKDNYTALLHSYSEHTAKTPIENTGANDKASAVARELLSQMVYMPGGSLTVGSGDAPDEAAHKVFLGPFRMGKYEVTQQQWQEVMGVNNSVHKNCPTCPAENVSWDEVATFLNKLNGASEKKFRLPTEAEWEYAAVKGQEEEVGIAHPDDYRRKWQSFIGKTTWYNERRGTTHPVGQKKPAAGLYDLLGNVSEWCQDFYQSDYQNDSPKNPRGPQTGERRLIKGGSFKEKEEGLRHTKRDKALPAEKQSTVGFRLATDD